jgi:RluA family pseudouridine synthase
MNLPPLLFEDDDLVAFDKPAGLLVVRDRWDADAENLVDLARRRYGPQFVNVHRLDRDTSGVVLCAKTPEALRSLSQDFEFRRVAKRYLAITLGPPERDAFEVSCNLAPDARTPGRMRTVTRGGKEARTSFRTLERWYGYGLVEAKPETGRTHQIRVHLAWAGHPVAVDALYGDGRPLLLSQLKRAYKHKGEAERPLLGRLGLHAAGLVFTHPRTQARVELLAPPPPDIELTLKYLRRFGASRSTR